MWILYLVLQLDAILVAAGIFLFLSVCAFFIGVVMYCCNVKDATTGDAETENKVCHLTKVARKWTYIGTTMTRSGFCFACLLTLVVTFVPNTRSGLILLGLSKVKQISVDLDKQTDVYKKSMKLIEHALDKALEQQDIDPPQRQQAAPKHW